MELELVTAPATPLFTTAYAKTYLRVDNASEDTVIDDLVLDATSFVEKKTGIKIMAQTWRGWLDGFHNAHNDEWWEGIRELPISYLSGGEFIGIPFNPLQSISSIKTYDQSNTESLFASSNYFVNKAGLRPKVVLNDGSSWPVALRSRHSIAVEFIVGYLSASDVPSEIKSVVKKVLAHFYENRGDVDAAIPATVTQSIRSLQNMSLC